MSNIEYYDIQYSAGRTIGHSSIDTLLLFMVKPLKNVIDRRKPTDQINMKFIQRICYLFYLNIGDFF